MDDDSAPARAQSLEPAAAAASDAAAAVAPANHAADTKQDHDDNASTQSHTTSHEKDVSSGDHVVQQKQQQSDESTRNDERKTQSESAAGDENTDYITGIKLYVVMASVALTCFVMLLDTSIISTVGIRGRDIAWWVLKANLYRPFRISRASSIRCQISDGIQQHTNWPGTQSLYLLIAYC